MVSSRSVSKRRLHGLLDQLRTPVELVVRPHRGMEQLYRRFGPVYTVGAGRARTVFLLGPEANKFVLGHSELFRWREAFETLTVVGGDTALIVSDGSAHQRRRRLVAPAFGARRVEGYATSMRAHIDAAIDAWRPGQLLDLYRELRQGRPCRHHRGAVRPRPGCRRGAAGPAARRGAGVVDRPPPLQQLQRLGLPSWRRARAARATVAHRVGQEIADRGGWRYVDGTVRWQGGRRACRALRGAATSIALPSRLTLQV